MSLLRGRGGGALEGGGRGEHQRELGRVRGGCSTVFSIPMTAHEISSHSLHGSDVSLGGCHVQSGGAGLGVGLLHDLSGVDPLAGV